MKTWFTMGCVKSRGISRTIKIYKKDGGYYESRFL